MGGKHRKCFFAGGCGLIASFGFKGDMAKFCSKHKEEGMVNLLCKMCRTCGVTRPTFNFEGLSADFCSKCRLPGMINVGDPKCVSCKKVRPTFNLPGLKPEYCTKCKSPEMIDIYCKKCFCGKCNPSFNFEGLKAEYCSKCKHEGMINVTQTLCKCGRAQPNYNFEGLPSICCAKCKTEGMIEIRKPICKKCGIGRKKFNFKDLKPIYCKECKEDGMINVVDKCKNPDCYGCGNIRYKYYCCFCFSNLFPLDPLTKYIKAKSKENMVRDFINDCFDGFQHDSPIYTGNCDCTHRRRIDHRKLIGNTLLCVETDEYQHKKYNQEDEVIRYDDLYMIHGGKFIFIRFNPDTYLDANGKRNNSELYSRLDTLKDEIEKHIDRIERDENTELIEIHYLFYDAK
jgi:EsV-1-7 cysteine-rich motif